MAAPVLTGRLAHGLRLGAAAITAASEGRPGVGGAQALQRGPVLGATALLCRVSGRLLADEPHLAGQAGLGAAQARLGDALTRALDPGRAALTVAAEPRHLVRELLPFALLGDLDTGHRAVARHLLDLGTVDERDALGDEPTPTHRLELAWLRGLAEGCSAPDIPAGSVLERGADLLHGELTDAHRLGLAVLHATDCGLLQPRAARPATSVADDAESLLGAALASANLDVAAELLWTWPMLDLALSRNAAYALAELDRAEATHGFLPGPEHDLGVATGLAPSDRSTYVIQTSYHTAVAGGVLAAALLRSERTTGGAATASGPTWRRGTGPTPDADPLPLLVGADGPWADALRGAPLADRVACTELVLGAELRTAAAGRDAARVHDVVAWATAQGWAHLASVRQASALLSRVERTAGHPVTLAS